MTTQSERLFLGPCDFTYGVAQRDQLPEASLPEFAFLGRSNVGKSTLINALTGRKALARTSQTPGRTQQLNFFNLGDKLMLVDLPGYGYSKAGMEKTANWVRLIHDYLRGRPTLLRLYILIDSRHGLKPVDKEQMTSFDSIGLSYQIILTKADKVGKTELTTTAERVQNQLESHAAAHPKVHVTSAEAKTGLAEVQEAIYTTAATSYGSFDG